MSISNIEVFGFLYFKIGLFALHDYLNQSLIT